MLCQIVKVLSVFLGSFILSFFKSFCRKFLLCIPPLFLFVLLSSDMVLASIAKVPQIIQSDDNISQVNIVNPNAGVSYNVVEQYSSNVEGTVINNNCDSKVIDGLMSIDKNINLDKPAKTILLEVTGAERSKLKGVITIVGAEEPVKFILVNPNGIDCDGCSFVNAHEVELRTDKIDVITDDQIKYKEHLDGDIYIGKLGTTVGDGALLLSSGKIKIEGKALVKEILEAKAYYKLSTENNSAITAKNIYINVAGDINISGSLYSTNDLKIHGKNISIAPTVAVNVAQIESGKSLELEGDNIYLHDTVKLKSGEKFLKITGKLAGFGNVESENEIFVSSPEDILLNSIYSRGDTLLVAKNDITVSKIDANKKGNVELYGKKIDLKNVDGVENLTICGKEIIGDFALNDVNKLRVMENKHEKSVESTLDFNVTQPLSLDGDFKFIGRNFINKSLFSAKNIRLELSGDFINDTGGRIGVMGSWSSVSRDFINYGEIHGGEEVFQVRGDTFVNDKGGYIFVGSVDIYLTGKRSDGFSLYQGSNSEISTNNGGIKLVAPNGGMYFGYKKEMTGDGDNKDGFKYIGSRLDKYRGKIHIQAGGDVIFDGLQSGCIYLVEAKGKIEARVIRGNYRKGTTQSCWKEEWCSFSVFGGCIGDWKSKMHCNEVPRFEEVVLRSQSAEQSYSNKQDIIFEQQIPILDTNEFAANFLERMEKYNADLSVNVEEQRLLSS